MAEEQEEIKVELPGVRSDKKIPQRKLDYAVKLKALLAEYNTCLIVTVTNVGSKQIAEMRKQLRGRARFLFGKNTMIRKVIRDYIKESNNHKLLSLLNLVKGNSGFVFTKESVKDLREEIVSAKVQCAAKAGAIAPDDVFVQPGPTGMEPTQTSFFQDMDIPTRINRGQIDIVESKQVVFKGIKVGLSEATLLSKLGIRPFYYGMIVESVYEDGDAYDASVLDLTQEDIAQAFFVGLRQVAALSFGINYPTITIVPHCVLNAYKKMLSLGLSFQKYSWENLELVKDMIENPDKFATAAPTGDGGPATGAAPVEEEEEEEQESSEAAENMFGDSSSSEDEDDDDDDDDDSD